MALLYGGQCGEEDANREGRLLRLILASPELSSLCPFVRASILEIEPNQRALLHKYAHFVRAEILFLYSHFLLCATSDTDTIYFPRSFARSRF